MNNKPLTTAVRNAIINSEERSEQFDFIMCSLGCSRIKAKEIYYAFIYHANEEYLSYLLQRGENVE